ncbi:NAD(+) kinase [Friedmanniomyces endolithicus]|uniref:NAD(+) kinase n=1 Tax=Rachicladosporium monterosium TaxID=1507873 RepID=A0ABR0L0C9_9PEZI|nr:NAD(+) kinase [Friedmanniomyces endolithicus]KAK5140604.1 NAD(+) kinase [Rachicladosporium monterosium]
MEDRQAQTTPGTPKTGGPQHRNGALAGALAIRTPIRRDSFDRPNGFPSLDSTPRRFSTGANAIPMPAPQVFAAQVAAEVELDEKRARMPNAKDPQHLEAALNKFKFCSDTPIHPDIPAILLTPICPHTLSFRPMLLNDDMALKVSIPSTGRGGAFVSFDGKGRVELGRGDEVVVRASQYPFPTVMGQPLEWFDSISRTLRWNTRAAEQKDWAGGAAGHGEGDGAELVEGEERRKVEEPEFDIDFAEEEVGGGSRDSGYGGTESDAGGVEREEKGRVWQ